MKVIEDLDADVAAILTGTNLQNVTNKEGAYERAARTLSQRAFIPEASGKQAIILYNGVFDYAAPAQIFGATLNDLRPQGVSRNSWDYVYRQPVEQFDRTKCLIPNGYQVTFEYNQGNPIMRVSQPRATAKIVLDPMSATTAWAVAGTASGLVVDNTVFYQSPGSLRFTVTGAGAGYIEKTLTNAINAASYQGVAMAFLAIDTPSASNLSSIELRLGSDNANYVALTVTQGFLGAWSANDFSLVGFDLSQAVTTGSPNFSALKYIRVTCNSLATLINMRLGGLFMSLPSAHELLFQTAAIFLPVGTSTPLQTITGENDQILLADPAYNIYSYECADAVAMQNGGGLSSGIRAAISTILFGVRSRTGAVVQLGLYDLYRAANPSEVIETTGNWYDD